MAKLAFYDAPATVLTGLKNDFGKVTDYIAKNSTPTDPFVVIGDEKTVHSVLVDADGNVVLSRSDDQATITLSLGAQLDKAEFIQQQINEYGEVYDETRIDANLQSSIFELTHSSDGVQDLQGVVLGKLTQDKLDQFVELGMAALDPDAPADNAEGDSEATGGAASTVLSSLNVALDDEALDELNLWFDDAEALVLEPYRWESVDANLQAFWNTNSDQVLAAYDLGAALDDAGWTPEVGAGGWVPPDLQPMFFEPASPAGTPDPIFLPAYEDFLPSYQGYMPAYEDFLDGSLSWSSTWSPSSDFGASSGGFDGSSYIDPLVLKLGTGSVHTTNRLGSKVMFDMNADGTRDRTGWITADEGFLVLDRNGNGIVDDASEMFSEYTSPKANSGFRALAAYDSNGDRYVDKWNDKIFNKLQLWVDININGVTDAGELHALKEFGIYGIATRPTVTANHYDNGNLLLGSADYRWEAKGVHHIGQVAEVLFNYGDADPLATVYLSDQATSVRTASGKVIEVLADKASQSVNASLSGVNVLVGGAGDILNAGNAGQSILIGNGKATMNGNAGDVHFIVNGSGNIVNTGSGSSWIEVHGDANTINAARGDVTLEVDGDRNRITIGSGADVTLGGVANTLTAVAKSHDNTILVTGINEVVIASAADIVIDEAASLTLRGKNNDITMTGNATLAGNASGGTLTVSGENNVATLSASFIAMTEGSGLTLTGGSHQVVMGGDASLTMKSSGAGSTIVVTGDDNQLNASRATVILGDGAGLDLNGSADRIILFDDADVLATGTAHRIDVYGTGNEVTANRSTVLEHAFAELDLSGTGNLLRVTPENSPAVKAELAAELALYLQMEKALDKFVELAGPMPGTVIPVEVSTVGTLSLAGSASVLPGSEILH